MANAEPIVTIHKNTREDVRITLSEYQGRNRLDLRQWADCRAGGVEARVPTKMGVNLSVDQIPELIDGLRLVHAEAVRRGMLEGGDA